VVQVRLDEITKTFGEVTAAAKVSLDISEGELFFLLGPSGCGKTTILRTIAGFETPDSGAVSFDGRDVTRLAPNKRNTGMVFQNYALWPHMTVFENVAYGLRVRGVDKGGIVSRVMEALELVRMTGERARYPNQLSGGQQQRVALARALVIKPGCLLLDEPLSNLDAKLRLEMRAEILRIHSQAAVTTIYVTHDQKEALSMADRVAILREGRVVQVSHPYEVYRRPADGFVAAFIGETNMIPGTISRIENATAVAQTAIGPIRGRLQGRAQPAVDKRCLVSVRPEDITLSDAGANENSVGARITQYTFLGEVGQYVLAAGEVELRALVASPSEKYGGPKGVYVSFPEEKVLIFTEGLSEPAGGRDAG